MLSTEDQDKEKTPPVEPPRRFFARRTADKAATSEENKDSSADAQPSDERDAPTVSFSQLFRFSTRSEIFIDAIGLLVALGSGAAQPLQAILFGNLTEDFVTFTTVLLKYQDGDEGAKQQLPLAAANFRHSAGIDATYLVYLGIGLFVCTFVSLYSWIYTGELNAKRIREYYLKAILRQDIAYFDDIGAGEITTRIQTDTHLVQQGISEKVALAVSCVAAFLTGFIIAFFRSWRLALALSSILPAISLTAGVMNKFAADYTKKSLKHVAEGGTLAEEVISTIRTAQAFGTQKTLSIIYDSYVEQSLQINLTASAWSGAGFGVTFFIIYSAYALTFSFGTTLINSHHATAGAVVNVYLSIFIGSLYVALLAPEMAAINKARGAAAKLYETIDRVPDIDSSDPSGLKPEDIRGEVIFEGVNFTYPSRSDVPVIKDLSLSFPAGKTIALVGPSGSGKSTIISLVERFYDPTSGSIKLDGVDLKDLNLKWLRSQIGLVSQEPILFAASIKENVAHGLIGTEYEHVADEKKFALIKEACLQANADGFIAQLPSGYETVVGERGFLLSGGQKQRVAIARAIISDPKILLLDEATSALDTQSEGIVQDALDKAAAGRTTVIIAHRLSTIKNVDLIYVLDGGLVTEEGSHVELIQAGGSYAHLVNAQNLRGSQPGNLSSETSKAEELRGSMDQKAPADAPLLRSNAHNSVDKELDNLLPISRTERSNLGMFTLFIRMGEHVRDQRKIYLWASIFAILAGLVPPACGIVFANSITGFSENDPHIRRFKGDRNALWFFVIAIIAMIVMGAQNYLFSVAASTLTARLRSLYFRAVLRQDVAFFDRDENSTGSLTSNLSEHPQKVNGLVGITLGTIIQSIATLVAGWILGLVYVWRLGLIAIACTPILVSTGYIHLRVIILKDQSNKKSHESSAHLACESAGSIRTVASLGREEDCLQKYSQSLEIPMRRSTRNALWGNFLFALSQSLSFFVIALVFWYGAGLVSRLEASTTAFFVALMSSTMGAVQSGNIFTFVPDISSASSAGSDIIRLLDSVPEIDADSKTGQILDSKTTKGHVRLENVRFQYPTRPTVPVLRNLTLEAKPGSYIAVVGASGSGKSTIIQLLERFYDPSAGVISLDGERIRELNVQEYRKHLALVSQEPTLYAGTIRFNIVIGAVKAQSEVTMEEIEQACRDANILEFIQSLPQGFDTEVGGKGSQLSGGQKQRIAIARALIRNPKVLLLDEATSALDSNSEKVVQEALDQAAKGRTTIAIAHRLSTIQNADCIYFIKNGSIQESGTHDELVAKCGAYFEYVKLQTLSKVEV